MNAAAVLVELAEAGVVVWLDNGRLRFKAPAGALTDELRARIGGCRRALVALLAAGGALPVDVSAWTKPWLAAWSERAGVMEFEGGLDREAAERAAEREVRVEHARAFVARKALVVAPDVAVAARPGGGPHR